MYNILSVDGRGATQALIATKIIQIIDEKLKQITKEGVIKNFDHISASSTASFPVALIAYTQNPKKTYDTVKNSFNNIFTPPDKPEETNFFYKSVSVVQNFYKACISSNFNKIKSYTFDNFDGLLKGFNKVSIGDAKIPLLLLSAKNSQKLETHYFSSISDKEVLLLDAIKACIADKPHFPPHELKNQGYFDHSFISKSSLDVSLSYIKKAYNMVESSLLVVNIGFDNLNITDYLKTETTKDKINPTNLLDISMSSGEDININATRFLKGNFWNIVVTQKEGILEEVHKFDKILDDEKINDIIKNSKICSNVNDECIPFYEGLDQMINNGLLNNTSIENEIELLTKELGNYTS